MGCKCKLRSKLLKRAIKTNLQTDIYLDYNATTPVHNEVLAQYENFTRRYWANPSSQHALGIEVYSLLQKELLKIQQTLKIKSGNLYFTPSATYTSDKLITIYGRDRIYTSSTEHNSLKMSGIKTLPVNAQGEMNPADIKKIKQQTSAPVLIYSPVNHETGAIQPIKEIWHECRKYNIPVILDAVQAAARLAPDRWSNYCDGFYLSGHKIYSTKGAGLLWLNKENTNLLNNEDDLLNSMLIPGTPDTAACIALSKALEIHCKEFRETDNYLRVLNNEAKTIFESGEYPYYLESPENAVPGVLCISLPWIRDIENFLLYLNSQKIYLSRFSACTWDYKQPSAILLVMGRPKSRALTSLRISFGRYSKRADFFALNKAFNQAYKEKL